MDHVTTESNADENGLHTVETSDGFKMTNVRVAGVALFPFPEVEQVMREFKENFQVREDDVWIVAYCNSGTHWIWEVASMITQGKAERIGVRKETAMLEDQGKRKWAMNELPSRRVLNTHVYPKHFPEKALKQNKFIIIVRNPKDTVVSRYNMHRGMKRTQYEGHFQGFLELFLNDKLSYGGWCTYLNDWWTVSQQMKDRCLFITYEDCKKDLTNNVRRIADFIGLKKDTAFYEEVARLCGFEKMKEDKTSEGGNGKEGSDIFYRKGTVGGWKNWFTVRQNEELDAKLDRELIETDLRAMIQYEI